MGEKCVKGMQTSMKAVFVVSLVLFVHEPLGQIVDEYSVVYEVLTDGGGKPEQFVCRFLHILC